MDILADLKSDLKQADETVERTKTQFWQAVGIQNYLKAKIAELEKPVPENPVEEPK